MKKWKMAVAFVLLAFGLWGCGGVQDQGADASMQKDTVKIGLLRIDDSFPFYVAEKEGLFAKHGVNVELVNFSSGRDQSTALAAGEIDGMMTDPVVTALSLKGGTEVRIVAMALGANAEEGRFLVVAAPQSGITAPAELEGKTVAISTNTMMDYLMEQYETQLGLDGDSIHKVNMPDLMLRTTTVLEGKDIDAAILPDPLAAYAVAEGAQVLIDDTQLGENFSQSVVVMTKDQIDNHRESVEKVLAAYKEAIALIHTSPESYRQLALECANVPEALSATYPTPTFTAGAIPSESDIARVVGWLVDRGLLETGYSYSQMVDDSFILQNDAKHVD